MIQFISCKYFLNVYFTFYIVRSISLFLFFFSLTKKLRALVTLSTLSSNFTWTEHIEYVPTKINQSLGPLRRIKSLFPRSVLIPDIWLCRHCLGGGGGRGQGQTQKSVHMNNLHLLQNNAAKTILTLPFSIICYRRAWSPWLVNLGETQIFSSLPLRLINEISAHNGICWQIKMYTATIHDRKITWDCPV